MPKISIIVTTKDPVNTFEKSFIALQNARKNLEIENELIITSPNKYPFLEENETLKLIEDPGMGKPNALNIAIREAKGEYLIFTDGDVLVEENSLKELWMYTKENNLEIAGSKPVVLNSRNNMLGYWGWVLAEGNAHKIRSEVEGKRKKGKKIFFPVSGYLFIMKKSLYLNLSANTLVDDAYISYELFKKGFAIGYCDKALVFYKFPETYRDYITQKLRTLSGFKQGAIKETKVRSFSYEAVKGLINTIFYAKSLKELFWSKLLILSRLHIWILVIFYTRIRKDYKLWKEVESSKNI